MTLPLATPRDVAERAVDVLDAASPVPDDDAGSARVERLVGAFARWGDDIAGETESVFGELLDRLDALRSLMAVTRRDDAAAALNVLLARHAGPPRLEREGRWGWHLHVDAPDAALADWFIASSAMALAQLLVESTDVPWGTCADAACGRCFVDHGRRERQRYCSTACATRARVRRHRRRRGPG